MKKLKLVLTTAVLASLVGCVNGDDYGTPDLSNDCVTITKTNYIPYLKNPGAVLIENKNLTSTYLNCTSLSAGYSVDPAQTDGNVVVVNGESVTFDVTGDIILAPGFEVQLGATFEAK